LFCYLKKGGNKLRKTVVNNGVLQYTQDYVGGIEYRSGALEAIYHSEGRIVTIDGSLKYEYALKDHLGNTRLMFCDKDGSGVITQSSVSIASTNEVTQENHYYAFGMNMEGVWVNQPSPDNRYQYNGKELNEDFGLNWNDYGARFYDAAIARWNSIDPKAEKYYAHNSYSYVMNRPTIMIDPDGKDAIYTVDRKNGTVTVSATVYTTGQHANAKKAGDIQNRVNDFFKGGSFKDSDGREWKVNFKIKVEHKANIKDSDLKMGDNILYDRDRTETSTTTGLKSSAIEMRKKGGVTESTHEIGHTLGLSDRYSKQVEKEGNFEVRKSYSHVGYETDLMGANPTESATTFNQSHYNDMGEWALRNTDSNKEVSSEQMRTGLDWKTSSDMPEKDKTRRIKKD
jgi:RHS repeat-associated protein